VRPFYGGGLVCALTTDNRLHIVDDGNWTDQDGGSPPYRSFELLVHGTHVYGYLPQVLNEDWEQALQHEGVMVRSAVASWSSPQLPPGAAWSLQMVAGNEYIGWGDDLGVHKMEWGDYSASDPSQHNPAIVGGVVPAAPPPPVTSAPNPQASVALWLNAVVPLRQMGTLYKTWGNANPREKTALEAYEAAVRAGTKNLTPPTVHTPTGRAFVNEALRAAYDMGIV
jgi:hypothetical protein